MKLTKLLLWIFVLCVAYVVICELGEFLGRMNDKFGTKTYNASNFSTVTSDGLDAITFRLGNFGKNAWSSNRYFLCFGLF